MRLLPHLALFVQALIAAGTFLVAKDTTAHLEPLQVAWFRILLSFLLVLPFYIMTHRGRLLPPRGTFFAFAMLGITGVTANQLLFLHGVHLSSPLNAALLYAFTPAVVLLGAVLFIHEQLTPRKVLGIALAIIGVLLVLSGRGLSLASVALRGDLLILVAVVAWSAYTLLGKPVLKREDPLTVITWSFAFGALTLLVVTPWALKGLDLAAVSWRAWIGIFYLSAMTSGVSFTLWYWALKRLDASQVAVYTNLQVPMTAVFAWWFLSEIPTWTMIFGAVLVMTGVTITQLARKSRYVDSPVDA